MRLLERLDVRLGAAHLVELAAEVEALGRRPGELHHLDVLGGAAIAFLLGREIAVAFLLGVAGAGDDVDGDAALGQMVEGGDLAGGQGRRHEARAMGDQEAQPLGVVGGVLRHQEALGRRGRVADQRQVEARLVVGLGVGLQIGRRDAALDDVDGGLAAGRRHADHPDDAHGHVFFSTLYRRRFARCYPDRMTGTTHHPISREDLRRGWRATGRSAACCSQRTSPSTISISPRAASSAATSRRRPSAVRTSRAPRSATARSRRCASRAASWSRRGSAAAPPSMPARGRDAPSPSATCMAPRSSSATLRPAGSSAAISTISMPRARASAARASTNRPSPRRSRDDRC